MILSDIMDTVEAISMIKLKRVVMLIRETALQVILLQ